MDTKLSDRSQTKMTENDCPMQSLTPSLIKKLLPDRKKNSQKGDYGHVLIVGGNLGMGGAARLAGEAALRVGAGLVSVAARPENVATICAHYPEIMCHGIMNVLELKKIISRASVLVLGPGLGQDGWARKMHQFCLTTSLPKIIDADGLNLLGGQPHVAQDSILTPHPGEAARLLGFDSAKKIQDDRISAINQLSKLGGVWILKGSGTLIKGEDQLFCCPYGNPGMASGGMGDALSGIIAGLVAQQLNLLDAAKLGVLVHALAGDNAAKIAGQRGMVASDLINEIRLLVNP